MSELIKNVEKSKVLNLKNLVEYADGEIVNLTMAQKPGVNMSLLAIDKGEMLSTHSAPGDALACVLDGKVKIVIDGEEHILTEGEMIVMPGGIPHSVHPIEKFKMLLTVVK